MNRILDKLVNYQDVEKKASLQKLAADLGEKNIPEQFVAQVAPAPLKVLYWREEATNVPNTTVEIWMLQDSTFAVFAGEYDGLWRPGNVRLIANDRGDSTFDNLTSAMKTVRTNFVFDQVPQAPQEDFIVSSRIKRLLKKANRK